MTRDFISSRYWPVILAASATIVLATGFPGRAEPDQRAALDALIQRLRHDERLVATAECVLTHDSQPTDERMIPLIQARAQKMGARPAQQIYSEKFAASQCYVAHWWRKEDKERLDQFRNPKELTAPSGLPWRAEAFDGEVVRTYERIKGEIYGSIQPSSDWFNVNRPYPFSFLYEYQNRTYSDLLVRSQDAQVKNEKGRTRVKFSHPDLPDLKFDLVFGDDNRLIQRDEIHKMRQDPMPRIYLRQTFSAYRRYPLEKGEAVWFPTRVDFDYMLGTADDGTLIVYNHVRVAVDSLKLNHSLADDLFRIQFPPGCRTRDARSRRLRPRTPLQKLLAPAVPGRTP